MAKCRIPIFFLYITSVLSTSFDILGQGLHRQLNITLPPDRQSSTALLSWQITPDFYVDVYELQRKKFQFRVDDGETKFIDIGLRIRQRIVLYVFKMILIASNFRNFGSSGWLPLIFLQPRLFFCSPAVSHSLPARRATRQQRDSHPFARGQLYPAEWRD